MNEVSELTLMASDEDDQCASSSFLKQKCKYCNGKSNYKITEDTRINEYKNQTVALLYGLHENPAPHIAFLCGLQVSLQIFQCYKDQRDPTTNLKA